MAIKPQTLQQPERDLHLEMREQLVAERDQAVAALEALRARIKRAKTFEPAISVRYTWSCPDFRRGWDAAIAEIETG